MARYVTAAFAKLPDTIATRYYHTDMLGSVRAITDETGAVVIRHDYRPFGEDTQPLTGDPNRFAGKQLDAETGQHYFDARYYRNTWGRFTTVDPLHVGAAMTDPQQWNRYAYARNNPLTHTDPTGLSDRPPTFTGGIDICANGGVPPMCQVMGPDSEYRMTGGGSNPGYCEGRNGNGDFYMWVWCGLPDEPGSVAQTRTPGPIVQPPTGCTVDCDDPDDSEDPDDPGVPEPNPCRPMPYVDRYLQHVNAYTINVGPAVAGLAAGLWPKSWVPRTGGRGPMLGSNNHLTSVPRALGFAWATHPAAQVTSGFVIGTATVAIGSYNAGVFASGLVYAAFPGSNALPSGCN